MTTGEEIQAELEAVAQATAERNALAGRAALARDLVDRRAKEQDAAARGLAAADAALSALDGMTWTRLRTSFTGRRTEELLSARTAQATASSALAAAQDRSTMARSEVARLEDQLALMGNLEERNERALEARATWLASTDPVVAAALAELTDQIGAAHEMLREVGEAAAAAAEADRWLTAAEDKLSSASSWSTYDTFFGGGMISSVIKHDRMDDASSLIRRADLALGRLTAELGDVGLPPIGGVEVSDMTRTLDIWMDNIFSDLSSMKAIARAQERVTLALRSVEGVVGALDARGRETRQALDRLAARRTELIGG